MICDICYKDDELEQHQDFCPRKPKEMPDEIKEIFGDIFNPPKKDK